MLAINGITGALAYSAASRSCPNIPPRFAIEFVHGANHIWIGGSIIGEHSSDELKLRPSRGQRETDYPPDNIACSSAAHFARSIMVPFTPLVNTDGLSNKYTDNLYTYAPRPTCSSSRRDCGSRYLFCHGTQFICISRIRPTFPCNPSRYGGVDPCYGACVNGVCTAPAGGPPVVAAGPPLAPEVPVVQDETCFNQNPCCEMWATNGNCAKDPTRMNLVCPASCMVCKPGYPLTDACVDRHPLCATYKTQGRCESSVNFMAANCRMTCNLCANPRSAGCPASLV